MKNNNYILWIFPTKEKWHSWKTLTRIGYIASLLTIITFIITIISFAIGNGVDEKLRSL